MIYDIAIIGAGCAGWQLLYQLSLIPGWKDKKILLLEEFEKPPIYPTWCFWIQEAHPLEFLSSKSWKEISIGLDGEIMEKAMHPYRYVYIEGERFYDYFLGEFISQNPHIDFIKPISVSGISKDSSGDFIIRSSQSIYKAKNVYSSRNFSNPNNRNYLHLSQNFVGWKVEFSEPVLNSDRALFMDFRNSSSEVFEFMYLLPFSSHIGMVEWTTFFHNSHPEPDYEKKIQEYLNQYFPGRAYTIIKKERGEIPMTNFPFKGKDKNGVILIGSAAGMIKSSTGYTFNRITRDSLAMAYNYMGKNKGRPLSNFKFRYYDTLLLRVLRDEPEKALKIFKSLFLKVPYPTILRFLDEETSFWEDVKIFSGLPYLPLVRALFKK